MQARLDVIIGLANPQLREKLAVALRSRGAVLHRAHDLDDILEFVANPAEAVLLTNPVLALDEAFIYPHVYEECVRIKSASRTPLTIVLLAEPRTRTRWDWNGTDLVLKLPLNVEEIADRVMAALAAQP